MKGMNEAEARALGEARQAMQDIADEVLLTMVQIGPENYSEFLAQVLTLMYQRGGREMKAILEQGLTVNANAKVH
jgi:hypothetical protein